MNYEPFLQRCKSKFPQEESLYAFTDRVKEVFADDDFSDNSKACQLFYVKSKIGKTQFFRVKKYVNELYSWLLEQGKVTQAQYEKVVSLTIDDVLDEEQIRKCYFATLNDALDFVSVVGGRRGLNGEDDLLAIKSIVILSWFGFSRSEIANAKKSNLIASDNSIARADGTVTVLPPECFKILHRFSQLDIQRLFPTGNVYELPQSIYLMRTWKNAHVTAVSVSQSVLEFNKYAEEQTGHVLSTRALRHNMVLVAMLNNKEQDSFSLTNLVKEITGGTNALVSWYKALYVKWKAVFYPEGSERNGFVNIHR